MGDNGWEEAKKEEFEPRLDGKLRLRQAEDKSVGILEGGLDVSGGTGTETLKVRAGDGELTSLQKTRSRRSSVSDSGQPRATDCN